MNSSTGATRSEADPCTEQSVETWQVRKPAVRSDGGVVVTQHYAASDIGAKVLTEGGNAVDAAVAAGLAIGAVEPWMSGLGGGGCMMVFDAKSQRAQAVDFGMRAPFALDPADYPLTPGASDDDLFGWPAVLDERNVRGPLSIATPGLVAGYALALELFGTRGFEAAVEPAIALAEAGMAVDWYATLKIASGAPSLSAYEHSRKTYLPNDHVPAGAWGGPLPRIRLGRLADTFRRLRDAGPQDFYTGEIASSIAADAQALGLRLGAGDLAGYEARLVSLEPTRYRGANVYAAPYLSAGPSLARALELMAADWSPGAAPDAGAYSAYANALALAYAERLAQMGESAGPEPAPSCTTHISVVDKDGNCVALTQTLLSVFGSKVMLPGTGMLMNNGVMWFDPRPGRPNSMAPGKRPLSNMCPTLIQRDDDLSVALGASGGRRIMPAVLQLTSFLVDFAMSVDDACHQPRIDLSGGNTVFADRKLPDTVVRALEAHRPVQTVTHGVYPVLFACPNVAARDSRRALSQGAAFIMSPWSKASAG
ncbi:MAG: gamma-glutamyltransferase family protein [Gammaproteobacteria bacterium]